jgi:hypothetical protein
MALSSPAISSELVDSFELRIKSMADASASVSIYSQKCICICMCVLLAL